MSQYSYSHHNYVVFFSQALESTLTHESIAKAIGIAPNKGLLRTHLGDKFVGIIGPIFAQKKVDLMQQKHFMPLDPLQEPPKVCMHVICLACFVE